MLSLARPLIFVSLLYVDEEAEAQTQVLSIYVLGRHLSYLDQGMY